MTALIDHIEKHLGPIEAGWTAAPDGRRLPFQVVRCAGESPAGPVPFLTLGLGNFPLKSSRSQRLIFQELLLVAPRNSGGESVPALLQELAGAALASGQAYGRGHVIALPASSPFEALYVSVPAYFPAAFHTFAPPGGPAVVFAWLVGITGAEARFVERNGWEAFEALLEERNPDLLDFGRESVV